MERTDQKPHVVIVGGGVAGLEALMALRDLAGDRVDLTLVAPEPDFTYKPLAVEEPFSLQPPEQRALEPIAREFGSRFIQAAVERVAPDEHNVELSTGNSLEYAMLLVCVGGRPRPAFRQGTTFLASGEPLRIDDLLANAATAPSRRIAFVVPPGVTWPLPIYELALMARRRAESLGLVELEHVVVTPESAPLIMFGSAASGEVEALLRARGIAIETGAYARETEDGALVLTPGVAASRPAMSSRFLVLEGPAIPGLPSDEHGFIPIDDHARVPGTRRRLRGRRRDDLPHQAGRDRHPAGGRSRRAHRRARGRAGESAALPARAARKAPHRRGVAASQARSQRRDRRGERRARLPVVAAAQDQRPLPRRMAWGDDAPRRPGAAPPPDRRRGRTTEGVAPRADGARSRTAHSASTEVRGA